MKRTHIILYPLAILILGIVSLVPFHVVHAAQASLTTTSPSPKVNERFAVTITLAGGDETLGTDVVLRYNPASLVVQEVMEGTLYPTYNPAGSARVNKESGLVVLSGSTGFGQSVPANGVFGTVSFVAIKDGQTVVTLDYEQGMTNKTGVISPTGTELLTTKPLPLSITVKRPSFFGALLSFFQSLWKKQ